MEFFRKWLEMKNSRKQLYQKDDTKPWFFVKEYEEDKAKMT